MRRSRRSPRTLRRPAHRVHAGRATVSSCSSSSIASSADDGEGEDVAVGKRGTRKLALVLCSIIHSRRACSSLSAPLRQGCALVRTFGASLRVDTHR
ncbi:hypothetical protein K437DRAFT_80317 [Tilletiaria anomala UBC 951]|uniref:Uncharacterized protein n=1 Tax=Tilletiaria anomala (strain ATCC 24038 / CBS 436.72 / UBC 951) TaxID=1037660 RepID=A0A066W9N1_TILAU|nr:uncharacterized protein K437DRAFT_80317 [Tilletiaria anomala UBC 951]KDN49253.1 hypothetical protein K437DRAFT_80317 [Tilletiaria anomala UBC 951]